VDTLLALPWNRDLAERFSRRQPPLPEYQLPPDSAPVTPAPAAAPADSAPSAPAGAVGR
jgi:hypothetical protein